MMFQYNSYVLEINPVSSIKGINVGILRGICGELDFEFTNSSCDTIISEFKTKVDRFESKQEERSMMKITFTYGKTVKISLTQDDDGFYVYTPKNNITSPIKFFSVKDAILFFSEFLPIKVYDEEENSLSFEVTLEYKNKVISFYMKDEDKTKRAWTEFTPENKGFNDVLRVKAKIDDSIDDVIRYFIKWVETTVQEKTTEPCIFLVQKILNNTPESANDLFDLLLDFKFKVEEGIGEKE